jgi:adenine modification enzyme
MTLEKRMVYEKNKNYYIKEIAAKQARDIVKRYHYSKKVVVNSKIHLGVFSFDDVLVGCQQLGPPMNGIKTSKKLSNFNNMMELNRMVMTDEEPRNAESQAISLCFKYLKKNTNLDYILSFSDGKQGNVGYIYQATNWLYIGYRVSSSFYDLDGDIVHNVTVWHRYKENHIDRDKKTTDEILYDNFNNVSKIHCKQFIYVYPLNKKCLFLFKEKQYPKKETETPIIKRTIYKENGVVLVPKKIEIYTTEKLEPII